MSRRDQFVQHARGTPFDNSTGRGFTSNDCQTTIEEIRDHTVYTSSTTAISAAGTLSLTSSSNNLQYLTGSGAGYSVVLPNATTIPIGSLYQIVNTTNETIDIKDVSSTFLLTLAQNSIGYIYLQLNGTPAGTWIYFQVLASSTATGIINYKITSSTPFATTSATDVAITGMTVTPQAGTYAIWYSATNFNTTNNALNSVTVYKDAASITDSTRSFQTGSSNMTFQLNTATTVQVNGTQAINIRVKTSTGTFTSNGRTMLLIRLGP